MEKYRSSEISGEIPKNRRYLAIYQRFGDKSPIFPDISYGQRGQTCYSEVKCATVPPLQYLKNALLLLRGF